MFFISKRRNFLLVQILPILPALFCILFCSTNTLAFAVPPLTSPVIDQVGLLHPPDRLNIEERIRRMKATGRVQPEVVILKSLEGEDIESVGIQLADQWKLGDKEKDQGLILIIAPNERKMRIEVGRGLEGDIPDAIARRIIGQILTPAFKTGLYASGIEEALAKIQQILSEGKDALPPETPREEKHFPWFLLLFLLFIGGNFLGPLMGYRRRGSVWMPGAGGWGSGTGGGFWGGGGGGGGSWGGGGGGFNGGGSSGSW